MISRSIRSSKALHRFPRPTKLDGHGQPPQEIAQGTSDLYAYIYPLAPATGVLTWAHYCEGPRRANVIELRVGSSQDDGFPRMLVYHGPMRLPGVMGDGDRQLMKAKAMDIRAAIGIGRFGAVALGGPHEAVSSSSAARKLEPSLAVGFT